MLVRRRQAVDVTAGNSSLSDISFSTNTSVEGLSLSDEETMVNGRPRQTIREEAQSFGRSRQLVRDQKTQPACLGMRVILPFRGGEEVNIFYSPFNLLPLVSDCFLKF